MKNYKAHDAAQNRAADFKRWILKKVQPKGKFAPFYETFGRWS